MRLIKPPQDPRLHLTRLGSDERSTAFRYHPPKSIKTNFEFYFEPCFSIGKNNNDRNDDYASNLRDSKITNNIKTKFTSGSFLSFLKDIFQSFWLI